MKFGDTLYQRSVPKWAAYNFKYNELKHLIKSRTSAGTATPVDIPSQGRNRWQELDNHLLRLLQEEYDNVTLFLKSKQGEIERRLSHLEKQIAIAQRAVAQNVSDRPVLQARKYQRLVKDSDDIADEVQNLARFAAVQKTAFRKILKKYRKWTGSTSLQTRVDVEVFSSEKLRTDYSDYLFRLTELTTILNQELAAPMLTGKLADLSPQKNRTSTQSVKRSIIDQINEAALRGPLPFDAALLTVPYGEVAGSAHYWIHPDNLDEARTLLLRHMRDASAPPTPSRAPSETSLVSQRRKPSEAFDTSTHTILFDNAQRFIKDKNTSRPTRVAVSAHYSHDPEAAITLAGLTPTSSGTTILTLPIEELPTALQRDTSPRSTSNQVLTVHNYLAEHRDVKPLAEFSSGRSRYHGITNSSEVATWATLDTNITATTAEISSITEPGFHPHAGDAFPYAVLHVRWEFARTPSVVRAFDDSHLAERVHDFTLEAMAIHTVNKDLSTPSWHTLLDKDIRKVPLIPRQKRIGVSARSRNGSQDMTGLSTGTSSMDDPASSVFSANLGHSSATSEEAAPSGGPTNPILSKPQSPKVQRTKKRARIQTPKPEPRPQRYWNEFDDGDSDVNQDEAYAIYVDPNAPLFPGADTVHKAFGVMYDSLSRGKSRIISWLPLSSHTSTAGEREPLFASQRSGDADGDSSGSDTDEIFVPPRRSKRHNRSASHGSRGNNRHSGIFLTPRQRQLERTIFIFYTGLIGISVMFLIMSSILLGTGRKKAFVEVDAGVVAGVVAAEACSVGAIILILIRKQRLSVLHWGVVGVSVSAVVVIGMALLALMFSGLHGSANRKSP